jgi:hypothetical protein
MNPTKGPVDSRWAFSLNIQVSAANLAPARSRFGWGILFGRIGKGKPRNATGVSKV